MEQKKKVLVVEDEIIVARDVQKRLENLGYDIVGIAATADEAISLAKDKAPDMILMDIMLKGDKDGIYAAEIIRSTCNIPIIFLTANSDKGTIERAKRTNAYGYLLKPFDDRELSTTIEMSLYKYNVNCELENNRHWFATMFKSIGDAVVALDNNGCVNFLNPIARQLLGVDQDDILGQPIQTYIKLIQNGSPVELHKQVGNSSAADKHNAISEFILETNNGEHIPIDFSARSILDDDGNDLGLVLAFKDVSERKSAEEEIREANRKLEKQAEGLQKTNDRIRSLFKKLEEQNAELQKLDHLKSEFISTVSHELRTPLTIIREGVSLVNDEVLGDINESQADMLKDIIDSTDRLAKIINDLLDVSKLESGKLNLYRKQTDTADMLTKLLKHFAIKANNNEIELVADFNGDLNPIYADNDRMIQVFSNLISNAIKFTPAQGKVSIRATNAGDYVRVTVQDTGKGISTDDLGKLFDKFSQFGRTAGPGEKGTGLGLSIAKSLVEMHEGSISVESDLGKGSSFVCNLPRYLNPEERAIRYFQQQVESHKNNNEKTCDLIGSIFIKVNNATDVLADENEEHIETFMFKMEKILNSGLYKSHDSCLPLGVGEFIIFLPDTNYIGACAVASKLKSKIAAENLSSNLLHTEPKFSFGALEYDVRTVDARNVLRLARSVIERKKKILIVDDHPQVVRLLSYRLTKEDRYECHGVFGGKEAIEFLEDEIPDLIILDIMMPEMSGYEVVGRLKEDRRLRDIPIILLTAMAVESQEVSSPLPGSIPVVSKTEGFRNLMHIIDNL